MQTYNLHFETPTIDLSGREIERRPGDATAAKIDLGNGLSIEMLCIPGGLYQMGSPAYAGYPDEHPLHIVNIAPFWLGRGQVTQRQWLAVMGKLPACRFKGPDTPIDNISWLDSQEFCKRLAKKAGTPLRLPSEAEWEYACRAGTSTPFAFGPTLTTGLSNYVGEHIFAQEPAGIYRHGPTPAGTFAPNAFGLEDMHGNLWEWCQDSWHEDYTGASAGSGAWAEKQAEWRVARGGSWHEPPQHCRSATRLKHLAKEGEEYIGLRVAASQI